MANENKKKISVEIDAKTAFEVDEFLRRGLAKSKLIPEGESRSIRSAEVSLDLDASTAALVSQLLRQGLITAGAAHESNNRSIAAAVGHVADQKQK
jgi:hypothetical protein